MHIVDTLHLRDIAIATTFWLSMGYNFGLDDRWWHAVWFWGWFSGSSYPMKTADFELLREVTMANIFGFLYLRCTLSPPSKCDWTIRVRWRYGLMSHYFIHLFYIVIVYKHALTLLVWRQEGHPACKKWEDGGGGHWLVQMEWRLAGWSVCLPLLIFPCTIKSRSSLLAPAHPVGPGKRAVKRLCVCGSIL